MSGIPWSAPCHYPLVTQTSLLRHLPAHTYFSVDNDGLVCTQKLIPGLLFVHKPQSSSDLSGFFDWQEIISEIYANP